jgi:hypothetical protein
MLRKSADRLELDAIIRGRKWPGDSFNLRQLRSFAGWYCTQTVQCDPKNGNGRDPLSGQAGSVELDAVLLEIFLSARRREKRSVPRPAFRRGSCYAHEACTSTAERGRSEQKQRLRPGGRPVGVNHNGWKCAACPSIAHESNLYHYRTRPPWLVSPPPETIELRRKLRHKCALRYPRKLLRPDCEDDFLPRRVNTATDNLEIGRQVYNPRCVLLAQTEGEIPTTHK